MTHYCKIELDKGIMECPKDKRFIVVHVFSGHMSVYCHYYDTLNEIVCGIASGIDDPQGVIEVKVIYDTKDNELLYYDAIGMPMEIHDAWYKSKGLTPPWLTS